MKANITDKTRAFEVTLANGHLKMPLADTLEEACIAAAAEGFQESGVGAIATVKDDKGRLYGDVNIKVTYKLLAVK